MQNLRQRLVWKRVLCFQQVLYKNARGEEKKLEQSIWKMILYIKIENDFFLFSAFWKISRTIFLLPLPLFVGMIKIFDSFFSTTSVDIHAENVKHKTQFQATLPKSFGSKICIYLRWKKSLKFLFVQRKYLPFMIDSVYYSHLMWMLAPLRV